MLEHFKYMPVLRYRTQERKALTETAFKDTICPLIEIVTAKPRANSKTEIIETIVSELGQFNTNFFLDIPLYLNLHTSTKKPVQEFIGEAKAKDPDFKLEFLTDSRLVSLKQIVPVISYDPNEVIFHKNSITSQEKVLRKFYDTVAFRVFPEKVDEALKEISSILKNGDVIIYEIDVSTAPNGSAAKLNYPKIFNVNSDIRYKTVLIRPFVPNDLTNTKLVNGSIISQIDNSLRDDYSSLGFDAFGDYTSIKKDELTDGGSISPGYIMYTTKQNVCYGFKGDKNKLVSFETKIAPSVITSLAWSHYSEVHHSNCMGCKKISEIVSAKRSGKSQGEWKGYSVAHYLQSMVDFL
ncbi:beta family protein [Sporolactobacillus terrae]|uniref:beta family protein n=1 Tax=Sporolactobacillus terrae TaxID=269673 RepID=UPI0004906D68|nr:hypothetical protein [Sporolactobacillus terrae]